MKKRAQLSLGKPKCNLHDPSQPSPRPPSPEHQVVLSTETQEEVASELPGNGDAPASGQYSCETCGKISKRLQEHNRHIREVHGLPRRCPLCLHQWKRGYKIKEHLITVHDDELIPEVKEKIHCLRGQGVVDFVEDWNSIKTSSSGQ